MSNSKRFPVFFFIYADQITNQMLTFDGILPNSKLKIISIEVGCDRNL